MSHMSLPLASGNRVRSLRQALFATVLLATLVGSPRDGAAYDPHFTHRWIARKAVEHLRATYPGQYDDVLPYLEDFVDGVSDEDNEVLDGDDDPKTLRVMRHFFRPTDGAGLTMFGQTFPSSLTWATTPRDDNKWGYDDALAYWKAGDPAKAFFAIGHVTHLIQDATVPAHTHLDIHGPPDGDAYESYCSSQMRSDTDGDLPLPAPGTPVPDFETLEDLWLATARASYYRNMVPGMLSDVEEAQASGVLAQMFPAMKVNWLTQEWEIPGVGKLGKAFWEYEPGLFYFKKAGGVGAVDRIDFDVFMPDEFVFGANAEAAMVENMARDLIPIAVLHSASVLKRFMDETRGIEVDAGDDAEPPSEPPAAGGCRTSGGAAGWLALVLFGIAVSLRRRGAR
jgi:hypothetical protein